MSFLVSGCFFPFFVFSFFLLAVPVLDPIVPVEPGAIGITTNQPNVSTYFWGGTGVTRQFCRQTYSQSIKPRTGQLVDWITRWPDDSKTSQLSNSEFVYITFGVIIYSRLASNISASWLVRGPNGHTTVWDWIMWWRRTEYCIARLEERSRLGH